MGNTAQRQPEARQQEHSSFDRFYHHSQLLSSAWRQAFHERQARGVMRDLWETPPELPVRSRSVCDFVPLNTGCRLPHGHFGMFPLVRCTADGQHYRMKIHCKRLVRQSTIPDPYSKILIELQVLANADHPFILKLRGYFVDNLNFYVITEDFRAGDLNAALLRSSPSQPGVKETRILSEAEARFIAAQLISALHYLHSINIMHRDVKTHNVLLRLNGYIVLGDFGFAKWMRGDTRCYSVLGTLQFMAPELLRGHGYSYTADFWGFGCILHQLVAGCPPYRRCRRSGNCVHFAYRNLLPPPKTRQRQQQQQQQQQQWQAGGYGRDQYTWEQFDGQLFKQQSGASSDLCDLLTHLLRADPYYRIGGSVMIERDPERTACGALDVMSHLWFTSCIDFDRLREGQLPAPWRPQPADYLQFPDSDWHTFDIEHHIDPNASEGKPPLRSQHLA